MNEFIVYDIRTIESARRTLATITGVPFDIWETCATQRNKYKYDEDFVSDVVKNYGILPEDYRKWVFIYSHVTTSANKCYSLKKYGILDLKHAYLCQDSELRIFLENKGIKINLEKKVLEYKDKEFNISFGEAPSELDKEAYDCWSIGRKFYFDYMTCGFLSVNQNNPYGGYVHYRPEILSDIDNLLKLNLSQQWWHTHSAYEVIARVTGENIIFNMGDADDLEEKTFGYVLGAYENSYHIWERDIVLERHVQISTQDIIKIKPLEYWK